MGVFCRSPFDGRWAAPGWGPPRPQAWGFEWRLRPAYETLQRAAGRRPEARFICMQISAASPGHGAVRRSTRTVYLVLRASDPILPSYEARWLFVLLLSLSRATSNMRYLSRSENLTGISRYSLARLQWYTCDLDPHYHGSTGSWLSLQPSACQSLQLARRRMRLRPSSGSPRRRRTPPSPRLPCVTTCLPVFVAWRLCPV